MRPARRAGVDGVDGGRWLDTVKKTVIWARTMARVMEPVRRHLKIKSRLDERPALERMPRPSLRRGRKVKR
jgi:hypothetical protein